MAGVFSPSSLFRPYLPLRSPLRTDKSEELEDGKARRSSQAISEDDAADSLTVSSAGNGDSRTSPKGKATPKPRTTFSFNHPPPRTKSKQRLRIRSRLLLQLHQVPREGRSFPVLDILPSTMFAPRVARRFPRVFRGRDGLGTNDLVVVTSDSYQQNVPLDDGASSCEDDALENGEVVATICQIRDETGAHPGKVEICLNHGGSWEATPLPNGSYEFVAIDSSQQGLKARWVPRSSQRQLGSTSTQDKSANVDKRFTFSIVNPNTRKHPIIASMTRGGVEVLDRYNIPSSSSPHSSLISSPMSPISPSEADPSYFDVPNERSSAGVTVETDEHLRSLIVLTGVWVALREGWSQDWIYNDQPVQSCPSATQTKKARVASMPVADHVGIKKSASTRSRTPSGIGSPELSVSDFNSRPARSSLLRKKRPESMSAATFSDSTQRSVSPGAAYLERLNRRTTTGLNIEKGIENDSNNVSDQRPDVPVRNPSRLFRRIRDLKQADTVAKASSEPDEAGRGSETPGYAHIGSRDQPPSSVMSTPSPHVIGENKHASATSLPQSSFDVQTRPMKRSAKAQLRRWSGLNFFSHTVQCP